MFWRSCSPSTVPVHGRIPENQSNFPGYGQGSLNICVRTLHAKDMFREKIRFGYRFFLSLSDGVAMLALINFGSSLPRMFFVFVFAFLQARKGVIRNGSWKHLVLTIRGHIFVYLVFHNMTGFGHCFDLLTVFVRRIAWRKSSMSN